MLPLAWRGCYEGMGASRSGCCGARLCRDRASMCRGSKHRSRPPSPLLAVWITCSCTDGTPAPNQDRAGCPRLRTLPPEVHDRESAPCDSRGGLPIPRSPCARAVGPAACPRTDRRVWTGMGPTEPWPVLGHECAAVEDNFWDDGKNSDGCKGSNWRVTDTHKLRSTPIDWSTGVEMAF